MNKFLFIAWSILAVINLVVFIVDGFDPDHFLIAALEGILAFHNYVEIKRNKEESE